MRHGWNTVALFRLDLVRHHHKGRRIVGLEVLTRSFRKDRRAKWPEWFAMLDAAVQNILHFFTPRISEDAAVAERARSELHSALKPADDLGVGDLLCRPGNQIVLGELVEVTSGQIQVLSNAIL